MMIVAPYALISLVPFLIGAYFVLRYSIAISRELRRNDFISKSQIMGNYTISLQGLSTIRAMGLAPILRQKIYSDIRYN